MALSKLGTLSATWLGGDAEGFGAAKIVAPCGLKIRHHFFSNSYSPLLEQGILCCRSTALPGGNALSAFP